MRVRQHLLHDKVIVDLFGSRLPLIPTLCLLIVLNFLVESELWHRFLAHILAKVLEQLIAQHLIEDLVVGDLVLLLQVFVHHGADTTEGKVSEKSWENRRGLTSDPAE